VRGVRLHHNGGSASNLRCPDPVVHEGIELSQAIDEFAAEEDVRDKQGAWGVLTRNLITRRDAVRDSVMNAFLPVLHRELYAAERLPKR
jgi:non-canonical (house-cleaning) NTP pyrophosphatase